MYVQMVICFLGAKETAEYFWKLPLVCTPAVLWVLPSEAPIVWEQSSSWFSIRTLSFLTLPVLPQWLDSSWGALISKALKEEDIHEKMFPLGKCWYIDLPMQCGEEGEVSWMDTKRRKWLRSGEHIMAGSRPVLWGQYSRQISSENNCGALCLCEERGHNSRNERNHGGAHRANENEGRFKYF